jgi:hypothetical protein
MEPIHHQEVQIEAMTLNSYREVTYHTLNVTLVTISQAHHQGFWSLAIGESELLNVVIRDKIGGGAAVDESASQTGRKARGEDNQGGTVRVVVGGWRIRG